MALETASYVANLVVSNPDGGDARSTADDHIRMIKASLRRTFPLLDSALSISAQQVHYIGDLSASVQAQLNALRDGSATVNFAKYANSASVAALIGAIPAARVADLSAANTFATQQALSHATRVDVYLNAGGTKGVDSFDLINDSTTGYLWQRGNKNIRIGTNAITRIDISADGTINIPGLITGTITSAQNADTADNATNASVAANAANAAFATIAATATSASSAAALGGYSPSESDTGDTIAKRTSAGLLSAVRYVQTAAEESISVAWILSGESGNGTTYRNSTAAIGPMLSTRNITSKSGTNKTLAAGSGPPSLVGSTNGDFFFYY